MSNPFKRKEPLSASDKIAIKKQNTLIKSLQNGPDTVTNRSIRVLDGSIVSYRSTKTQMEYGKGYSNLDCCKDGSASGTIVSKTIMEGSVTSVDVSGLTQDTCAQANGKIGTTGIVEKSNLVYPNDKVRTVVYPSTVSKTE